MADSIVKQKSYDFALKIIKLCSELREDKHFVIENQLLRSGTSIGANVEEALGGQSEKDFYAKMCIALKEARETDYWLRLIRDSKIVNDNKIEQFTNKAEELIKILTGIVKTGHLKKINLKNLKKTKDSRLTTKD